MKLYKIQSKKTYFLSHHINFSLTFSISVCLTLTQLPAMKNKTQCQLRVFLRRRRKGRDGGIGKIYLQYKMLYICNILLRSGKIRKLFATFIRVKKKELKKNSTNSLYDRKIVKYLYTQTVFAFFCICFYVIWQSSSNFDELIQ